VPEGLALRGITGLIRDAATARAAGSTSTWRRHSTDRRLARSARAAALGVAMPCGLATLGAFVGVEPFPWSMADLPPDMLGA